MNLGGYKTILCAIAFGVCATLVHTGVIDQSQVKALQDGLEVLIVIFMRLGVKKAEDAARDAK